MHALGFKCITLPSEEWPTINSEIDLFRNEPFVLITTSHFLRDRVNLRDIYPDIRIGLSPLQIISSCNPICSIFYPHDPAMPMVLMEPSMLNCFDLVLWPTSWFGYHPKPRNIIDVGWIGDFNADCATDARLRRYLDNGSTNELKCWFFSDFVHHHKTFGLERTFKKVLPILQQGVAIKFPAWSGSDEYESYFSDQGVDVIPSQLNTIKCIRKCSVVISNSLSGITFEAILSGVPVINLLEPWNSEGTQRSLSAGIAGCTVSSYEDFPKAMANPPRRPSCRLLPFNFEVAIQGILEMTHSRSQGRNAVFPAPPR